MEKKKEGKEDYATDDPTDTSAKEQEDMVKEAIKKIQGIRISQTFISYIIL